MSKKINKRIKNNNKKLALKIIVVIIFLYFITSFLVLSKREYLYIEKGFKTISSKVNDYFIKKIYSNDNFSDDVLSTKYEYLQKENDALKQILELKKENENYVVAEVTNMASKYFFGKITVNKGSKDGIKRDSPVISYAGLIGFVSKTSKYISEIDLLTNVSENNMISVLIENEGDKISGVLSDYDSKNNLFKITDVMSKKEIKSDSKVILSGYNNDLYKGIYVGKVVKEESSNYGLSKVVWVKSDVDFDDILYTIIIGEK